MPGRINDDDIVRLREQADLARVAGERTLLQKAGGSRLKGLCPFHSEKTPSFYVDGAKGYFHCFGCDAGGDVYDFLIRAEALSFPEAVERLARLEGYTLRYEELSPGQRKALGRRTRLVECMEAATRFFEAELASDEGAPARAYLTGRGVDDAARAHFRLGWAPDRWDPLSRHLLDAGFTPDELADAGLATAGSKGPRDRFRGRVIFPIVEAGGRDVVAFGGRVLPGVELVTWRDGAPPKYVNSPETSAYKKSRTLYGLNWARAHAQRAGVALVVEGYMDVIGLHLAGMRNAVATCGTALTAEHFRLLEKHAARVVLALDADEAGFAAADRARSLAAEAGVREVAVLALPPGQDPADLAAGGTAAVERALGGVVTAVEFQIAHLLRTADVTTPEGQIDAYRRTFPLLMAIDDRFLRYRYVRDVVAPAVRLNADEIERELDASTPRDTAAPAAPSPAARPRRPGDLAGSGDPQVVLERAVLQVALQRPDLLGESWDAVTADDFRFPMSRQLFAAIRAAPSGTLEAILAALPDDELRGRVRGLALGDLTVELDVGHVTSLVADLRAASVAREVEQVRSELDRVHGGVEPERRRALVTRLLELERHRRELLAGNAA